MQIGVPTHGTSVKTQQVLSTSLTVKTQINCISACDRKTPREKPSCQTSIPSRTILPLPRSSPVAYGRKINIILLGALPNNQRNARVDTTTHQGRRAAVKREAENMPLFPELRRVHTVEQRIEQMDARSDLIVKRLRAGRAAMWREARAWLRELPLEQRTAFLAIWNTRFTPGGPANLFGVARLRGFISPQHPSQILTAQSVTAQT